MKKEYESRIEEAVHSGFRIAELAGIVSKQKWLGLLGSPVLFFVAYAIMPTSRIEKLIYASLIALMYIPVYLLTYKRQIRKQLRKTMVKALGTDKPIPCEYELDEAGLVFRKMGEELRFSWANAREVIDTDDSVEVIMEPTGIAVIPKRIFDEPAELQEWVKFIRDHMGTKAIGGD